MKRSFSVLPASLSLAATDADRVGGLMEMFNSVVATAKISFARTTAVDVEPKVFLYRIEAVDGRVWRQHITFDSIPNPLMTFEVADAWRLTEFSNQRNVRNALVALVAAYPDIEKVVYDFLVPQ